VNFLSNDLSFPALNNTDESGILAIGGDLSIERLKLAYRNGIFPWYSDGDPIVWYSPDPRMVLLPKDLRVSKSMRQLINSKKYKVTFNTAFESVISNCKSIDRSRQGEQSTWITSEMKEAYIALHQCGVAKSVEVWEGNELIGGLYGVEVGKVFCGESMFSKASNASKLAFIKLVRQKNMC
jgi:leucyl/phenylalanyl-tRNA--protein transferase